MGYRVNRYTGRFAPSGKAVVDAPSMSIAVKKMTADNNGEEPIQVSLDEKNISVILEEPQVSFNVVIKMKDGSIGYEPGNVYPEAFHVDQGTPVLFTALVKTGFKFIHYIDVETSRILGESEISSIIIDKNITIGAIYDFSDEDDD